MLILFRIWLKKKQVFIKIKYVNIMFNTDN